MFIKQLRPNRRRREGRSQFSSKNTAWAILNLIRVSTSRLQASWSLRMTIRSVKWWASQKFGQVHALVKSRGTRRKVPISKMLTMLFQGLACNSTIGRPIKLGRQLLWMRRWSRTILSLPRLLTPLTAALWAMTGRRWSRRSPMKVTVMTV